MNTQIGLLTLQLHIPLSHSLKEKRRVIRRVKDRVSNKFNVSIAEIGGQDSWQRCDLGIGMVGNDAGHLERSLNRVESFIESVIRGDAEVIYRKLTFR